MSIKWKLSHNSSLLRPFANSETAKKLQREFDQFEMKTFNEWKNNIHKELTKYIDNNASSVIIMYCGIAVAQYYEINAENKAYDYGDWVKDVLGSKIPNCLVGKVKFGDVVEVPGYRGSGVYIVSDVQNHAVIQVGQNGSGQIDIPIQITNDLCDPIAFYRFCSPTQGLVYQDRISFSFNHSYIQTALGLRTHNIKNMKHLNFALYAQWYFYIEENKQCSFRAEFEQHYFKNLVCEPVTIQIDTDLGEISVPTKYAKDDEKPLIYYVDQLYSKYSKQIQLKKRLNIQEHESSGWTDSEARRTFGKKLPSAVRRNILIMHAMVESDKYDFNMFDVELRKPLSWSIEYPSVDFGTFKGMSDELAEMHKFIESSNYIHLCYAIETRDKLYDDDNPSFCDLYGLISPPHFGIAWTSTGGCNLVVRENINIAAAMLRGMKLFQYPGLRWKILNNVVSLSEYKTWMNSGFDSWNTYLIHEDDKCIALVMYLVKYHQIRRKMEKYDSLTNKEYQALLKYVTKILN